MNRLHKNYKWLLFLQNFIQLLILAIFLSFVLGSTFAAAAAEGVEVLPVVVVVFGIGFIIFAGLTAIAYGIAAWWYRNYTYELTDQAFRKEYGILTKRRTSIPYERIQNVDIVAPLLYRIFGLAQLNVQTAGGTSFAYGISEGRLPGLAKAEAERLQAELIKRAQSSSGRHAPHATNQGV
jgi:putative membrane protein